MPQVREGVGVVRRERWLSARCVLLEMEDASVYVGERQLEGANGPEVKTVEIPFRRSNGDQGQKGSRMMRMKGSGDRRGKAVELFQKLYQIHEKTWTPLMAYRSYGGWHI